MTYQMDKVDLTKQILAKIPTVTMPVQSAVAVWWYNIRDNGGMRLTKDGFKVFNNILKIKSHKISYDAKKRGHNRMLIELDNKLKAPYYISARKTIYLFGEKEAVLALLYSDLEQFIKHYT